MLVLRNWEPLQIRQYAVLDMLFSYKNVASMTTVRFQYNLKYALSKALTVWVKKIGTFPKPYKNMLAAET